MIKSAPIKIAIASGKGGTGKTFIATNLYYTLQQKGAQITLIDCDAEEPNDLIFFDTINETSFEVTQKVPVIDETKCSFCGRCHEYCNYNAIFILPPSRIINVIDDLCHGCGACTVACADGAISEKDVVLGTVTEYTLTDETSIIEAKTKVGVYSPVSVIKKAIGSADKNGIALLDAPPGTSCPFIHTVAAADYVVLVTEPTPFGLSDLKHSVETLKTLNKPYGVIINRAGLGNNDVYNFLNTEKITLLMEIPFERNIASYYSKGQLPAAFESEWENRFLILYDKIISDYGNCNH